MRRATIRTEVEDAERIAAAVVPDNTPEIETRVEDGAILTTIERETSGGLQTTIDDYVVNLSVATQVVQTANQHTNTNYE
ncbi:KEOPS complex Pcc1-like subunit [Haladaptatus sp. W1]|uniref:KEOPS complex subunit Pcc1 n=1 Tax=Haladaptatus sp. W1 TaxID=1897478 RepID=UPI000849DADF|nr:KEOPS complex subunit Pcc1 [Haladaptatus sp. W1]ODR82110.1 KEOPS complex Pcc1-like subunit [Haladaptatus sp. W1]